MIENNFLLNKKQEYIDELNQRVEDKILNKANAEFLTKLINKADDLEEVQAIMAMGTTYKRTGFHFDFRKEPACSNIKYLKKNENLSFQTDKNALTHKLIIGDNYDALKQLLITHKGKIDVIYIDPPYGKDSMGNFANTNYTNAITRDNLLSMLYTRLQLAKNLLSSEGVIFVSIDDKNHAYLKCLMDEIFGEENFISMLSVENNPKGRKNSNFVSVSNEYCLIYAKNKNFSYFIENIPKPSSDLALDENGIYVHNSGKRVLVGENSFNKKVENFSSDKHYSVYFNERIQDVKVVVDSAIDKPNEELLAQGYRRYYSFCDNEFVENTYSKAKFLELIENEALDFKADKIYEKNFSTTTRIKSLIVNKKYKAIVNNEEVEYQIDVKTTSAGTELKSIFNTAKPIFSNPKNVNYIKLLISLMPSKDLIALDFFAGSGTTGQAILNLNKEDNGNRKFILCTNNEITDINPNGIAYDVTSKRLKRVMTGECYDGTNDFKWLEKNEPYGNNLEVTEITEVSPTVSEKDNTPFDLIDETLYGIESFKNKEDKINWICTNFKNTMKNIETDEKYCERWGE